MADIVETLIPAGGGDYTLMSVAESTGQALYGDLVGDNNTYTLECYDGECLDSAYWDGWIDSVTNTISIIAKSGDEYDIKTNTGFRINAAGTNNVTIEVNQRYLLIRGIGVFNDSASSNALFQLANAQYLDLIGCTFSCPSTVSTMRSSNRGTPHIFNNCLIINTASGSCQQVDARNTNGFNKAWSSNTYIANTGFAIDIVNSTSFYCDIQNNVFVSNATAISTSVTSSFGTLSNNATSDASIPWTETGSQVDVVITDGVDFVSPSTDDYSPASSGKLAGTGADLSTDFTTDITGATRTVPWTIGAYIVAGGPPPVGIQEMYIKDGGIFVKYTPHVKVGGTFQEVDAYVLEAGSWVPVHEK